MCAYNKVNGAYACENGPLFAALKHDWSYRGWIMSDWGAVHSTTAAIAAGLDQESGQQLDKAVFFGAPLEAALKTGEVPAARLDDMVTRIVYGMAASGLLDPPTPPGPLNTAADAAVAQRAAEAGIVLLKNDGVLPLARTAKRIAVIGGHADIGVLSGGGSSQVEPKGSVSFPAPKGSPAWGGGQVHHPSSPLTAIRARGAQVNFDAGTDPASAIAAARSADVAIVFATQWTTEGADASLVLPDGQDALIAAVAAANPRTIVVLETGGPVFTPWLDKAAAVLEAWYPGQKGGEAIARVLFGEVDAAGRLPVSFPASLEQLPRPKLDGEGSPPEAFGAATPPGFTVRYDEGADVGYRWYEKTHAASRFPFGYGLSYARFRYGALKVSGGAAEGELHGDQHERPGGDRHAADLRRGAGADASAGRLVAAGAEARRDPPRAGDRRPPPPRRLRHGAPRLAAGGRALPGRGGQGGGRERTLGRRGAQPTAAGAVKLNF